MKLSCYLGLSFVLVLLSDNVYSQTNIFPPSGNVGIGTTDPGTSSLKIYKDTYPKIMLADNSGRFTIQLAQSTGDAIIRKWGSSHSINLIY